MADLRVDIAAEFTGKKAFKDANKATSGLDKTVKNLARTFVGVFAAQNVIAFSKASVKAFAEDEKGATRLAKVVDNLGLSFANPEIASFIDKLQMTSGVLDDNLRPAFQALLTTTGSLTQSQQLLTQAIDISRGSGVELTTVAQDLALAYVGNTKGLKKYNLGLTKAELAAASFTTIQQKLTQQFSGSSAAYLGTYSGKMEKLTTAADQAKEAIGKGLVDSLLLLAGGGVDNIDAAASSMNNFAIKIGDAIYGLSILIDKLGGGSSSPSWMKKLQGLVTFGAIGPLFDALANTGKSARVAEASTGFSFFGSPMETLQKQRDAAAAAKAEKDAKARALAIANATKKNTAELKKQALTKKQSALFDMEQIQIIAALKGKITAEDKLRLELQLALLTGNTTEADKLSNQLANSIDSTGKLAESLRTLPDAKNPFKSWDAFLDSVLAKAKLAAQISGVSTGSVTNLGLSGSESIPHGNTPVTPISSISSGGTAVGFNSAGQIVVNVGGSVVSENDLIDAILLGIQNGSLSGSPSAIGRINGMFQ